MCQALPYADFRWVDDAENFDVTTVAIDSLTSYVLELDLKCPQTSSQRSHKPTILSNAQETAREKKLLATLYNKKHYVIYYRNLQQCIQNRKNLPRTAIRTISMASRIYRTHDTNFRILANNEFEKNLYKLMNNAVFDKTMENVRNYVDV